MSKIKKDEMSVKKNLEDLDNRFKKFIKNVSNEVCDTFKPEDLGLLITGDEMVKMESEGWFHPETDERDTQKHICIVIANRLYKK